MLPQGLDFGAPATHGPVMIEDRQGFDTEVVIVGGGMVGLTLATALGGAGIETVLLDALAPETVLDPGFDGRVSALAHASCRMLEAIEVWPRLAPDAQPILDILVSDGRLDRGASPVFLHFDHRALDGAPLGQIAENRHIRAALLEAVGETESVTWHAPARVARTVADMAGVTVTLADGASLRARLCVAADGRDSRLRKAAGIKTIGWSYPQTAIVATVAHEYPHHGVAQEYFLPSGPFAILPMTGNRSSLVWTERADLAPAILALDAPAFGQEMRRRFGSYLGATEVVGPRFSYPVGLQQARRYVAPRLALVGDAAHVIHPIAGQGLNLGLKDVAALAELVADAARLGLDLGGADTLARYERWRRTDSVVLAVVTDGLNRLFSNDRAPVRLVRDLGLGAVDRLPPLKRLLMRHARGTLGDLPRLLQGEPL